MIRLSLRVFVLAFAGLSTVAAWAHSPSGGEHSTIDKPSEQSTIENSLIGVVSFMGEETLRPTLEERMAQLEVRSASVAIYRGGELHWASAYGEAQNVDTLFQAASLSKAVAAVGIVALAREVGFDLDADLTRSFAILKDPNVNPEGASITLRQLLSHSAGTTISGFPGYDRDGAIPSTLDIALGRNGSTTTGIQIEANRIGQRRYSGGGFHLAQLWAETVSGETFPSLMQRLVLEPVGMRRSTFDLIASDDERAANLAPGYGEEGLPADGGWLLYPQSAAAGLWSTPTDYGRFISALIASVTKDNNRGIHPDVGREVLNPAIGFTGLGVGFQIRQAQVRLSNSGDNRGYWNHTMSFPAQGDVIVVMTNGPGGFILMGDINRTAAEAYHWPSLPLIIRERMTLSAEEREELSGQYVDPETREPVFKISVDQFGKITLTTHQPASSIWSYNGSFELVKTAANTFTNTRFANELIFERDQDGMISILRRESTYVKSTN